jgi:hypothetical protein
VSDESATDNYTVSFKTSGGYDASLLVVRGNTVDELQGNIRALQDLFDEVVETENLLHAAYRVKAPEVPVPAPQAAAPATTPTDSGEVRMCVHGKRTERSGTSAKGSWTGFFCPQPKGAPDQCPVEWKDKK